jgi:GntR family galactonate operon transcriptional repressor
MNQTTRKSDAVLDKIGLAIVSGRYLPGDRLPTEDELARKLRVSRPSLREGLKALARKGLVESRTRRGTIALGRDQWDVLDRDVLRWTAQAPPDHEFLIGLIEARSIFEPAAAKLAAQRATPAQIIRIDQAFRGMAESLPDLEGYNRYDLQFHESIIAASGNVMLTRLAITIRTALIAQFRVSSGARESAERSLQEHGAVAIAIRRREPEEAEDAMRRLLRGTVRDLEPAFSPQRNPKRRRAS